MEAKLVKDEFRKFMEEDYKKKLALAIKTGRKSLTIDFKELALSKPELSEELLNEPESIVELFKDVLSEFNSDINIYPRVINLPEDKKISIRDIRAKHISYLIAIEGLVRQASDVRPVSKKIIFECPACAQMIEEIQGRQEMKKPTHCPNCGRRGVFNIKKNAMEDTQRLVIEEMPEMLDGGSQPKKISVFLEGDLVDPDIVKKNAPGSKIKINGVVKDTPIYTQTGAITPRYDLLIEANNTESVEEEYTNLEITEEDEKKIKELALDKELFSKLIASIAPTIMGHEKIKLAIALQVFGGVRKIRSDNTTVRGNIHVILVGDPGVAKSQLLKYVAKISPKARYVAGTGSTGPGLTATVVKDEFLRGWSLEAGALVLANGGTCCIDEIDKMSQDDRVAMHEAMEQETVSISKANIQATLRAETTILAAANPKLGRFDPYETLGKQIDMPPTLLNRFDLIFTISDVPSVEKDTKIAQHVFDVITDPNSKLAPIEPNLFKRYVAYAKQNVKPKLSPEAREEIMNFYVNLRNKKTEGDGGVRAIPISARQLEGMIRLSEASARIRLDRIVSRADAIRAVDLMKWCLRKVGVDPDTGELDIDRIISGITFTQRDRITRIKNVINSLETKFGGIIPIAEILNSAEAEGIEKSKAEEIIEKMRRDGEIFEPKHGEIRKMPR